MNHEQISLLLLEKDRAEKASELSFWTWRQKFLQPDLRLFRQKCCTTQIQNAIFRDRWFRTDTLCWP